MIEIRFPPFVLRTSILTIGKAEWVVTRHPKAEFLPHARSRCLGSIWGLVRCHLKQGGAEELVLGVVWGGVGGMGKA